MADRLVIGILAHVDAGKTTLSEGILYLSRSIRRMGRIDNGDTFLDTDAMEKARGITIFSKQARFAASDSAGKTHSYTPFKAFIHFQREMLSIKKMLKVFRKDVIIRTETNIHWTHNAL